MYKKNGRGPDIEMDHTIVIKVDLKTMLAEMLHDVDYGVSYFQVPID